VAQVFAGDFVRQVVTNRPPHKGFGDEIERRDMRVKVLTKRKSRIGSVRFQGSLPRVPPAGRFPGPGFERSREPR
jgi:hypothetical protein